MEKRKNEIIHYGATTFVFDKQMFYLDHSCDEWIIGDLEEAKAFYKELGNKIKEVEGND